MEETINLGKIIEKFDRWYLEDVHSKNIDIYKDIITKENIESLQVEAFIEFFYDFVSEGGKIQTGGHRLKNSFKDYIRKEHTEFKIFVLKPFKNNFNIENWFKELATHKYFGIGIATIYLNRINSMEYSVFNNKALIVSKSLGIVKTETKNFSNYSRINKFQKNFINMYPAIKNLYKADSLNHYLIGTDEGKKLFKNLVLDKEFKTQISLVMMFDDKIEYPFSSYSWTIYSPEVYIKTMDKSCFHSHGTAIPVEIRKFFGVSEEISKDKYNLILIHKDIKYSARIEFDNIKPSRTRLFWKSDFSGAINKQLPGWAKYFENDKKNNAEVPSLRLEKTSDANNVYTASFINTDDVENDVKIDGESNRTEGKSTEHYGKRYERNPKNRKRAIEIHGLKCAVCGFDFEEVYGEVGKGYIEIHHLKPLYTLEKEQRINPRTDLIPVCSNCHRMIHRNKDITLTIEEIKERYNDDMLK